MRRYRKTKLVLMAAVVIVLAFVALVAQAYEDVRT